MYIIISDDEFVGFSLKEEQGYENIKITEEQHGEYITQQSKGKSLKWNKSKGQIETLDLSNYEYIAENGEILRNRTQEIEDVKKYLKAISKVLFEKEDLKSRAEAQENIEAAEAFQDEIDRLKVDQVEKKERLTELQEQEG